MIVWHAIISAFLTPPGLMLFPVGLGLLLMKRYRVLSIALVVISWAALVLVSLPLVSISLARYWQIFPALTSPLPQGPQAIVVLAGSRYHKAPEYGDRSTVGTDTLVRLRYAARLYRKTHLPVLVSGGAPLGGRPAALLMRHVLLRDFHVPVQWAEGSSRTTVQNATNSASILKPQGVHRIFLVTQAWHMRRAVFLFRRAGFDVTPAPTGFLTADHRDRTVLALLPNAHALAVSSLIFHEMIGLAWAHVASSLPSWLEGPINHG